MSKFDDAKVGDRVFSTVYGWGKVFSVDKTDVHFPLVIEFDKNIRMCYRSDGTTNELNKFPNLYWNEVKLPTEEEDKKPFDLVKFLREKLEPKEFVKGAENVTLFYNWSNNTWEIGIYNFSYVETTYISKISEGDCWLKDILNILTQERITPQQLKQAYKELGWL